MKLFDLKNAGHWPTLLAAFLYFDFSFMVWTVLGPLGAQVGFCFPLFSIALPRKLPSMWKTVEASRSKIAANCCKSTYVVLVGYMP